MRMFLFLLLWPSSLVAQINPLFVHKTDMPFTRLEASGSGMFGFEKSGKFGYANNSGSIVIPATYDFESTTYKTIPTYYKGYVKIKKDNKWGMLDRAGKIVIPFEYETIGNANTGRNVSASKKESGKTVHGLLDMDGKTIIPFEFEDMIVDSQFIVVKKNGKYGLFDHTGKKLLDNEYTSLVSYSRDNVLKAEMAGKYGFIDRSGKWLFEKAKSVFSLYGAAEGRVLCVVSSKYGFLDLKGEEVIVTRYDNGYGFENIGLAKMGKKIPGSSYSYHYGYIDKAGNEVIPIKYESMGTFSQGLVSAKDPETNRWGFLDKTGKWAINPVYMEVMSFDEHGGAWAKMTDGKYHYITKAGKDLGMLDDNTYKTFKDGYAVYEHADYAYALIDKTGKTIKKLEDVDGIYTFLEGIAGYKCKSNSKYGFVDMNGNKIIDCQFDGFTGFVEGISKVDIKKDNKNKSGYINTRGEAILPIEYDDLRGFRSGWGLLKKDGNFFFVDKTGTLREPPRKYDHLTEFRSGFAVGTTYGDSTRPNKYYYINTNLKEEFSMEAEEAYQFWENVAVVATHDQYELMNKTGKIFKGLGDIETLKFCSDGMLAIKEKKKWGFMDDKGNIIVTPKYDSVESFKYGYGRFKQNGKWGLVDKQGREVIEAKYENIFPGENGVLIYYDGGWGVMDKTGKMITPPKFYTVTVFEKDRALARFGKSYTIIKSPLLRL